MANDVFALSPMTASGTLPSEADYEFISEAFMETARGRWFLKEYTRRNRNADTAMVLEAVSRIETTIAVQKRQAPAPELAELMERIRPVIDEAKTLASNAIDQLGQDETFAPSRRGVRIIQEVAWRLREIGYDARICDILDSQANAINANHDASVTQETLAAVLAAFDQIAQQIGNLVSYGVADPAALAASAAKSAPPPADLAEARLAREKSLTTNATPIQQVEQTIPHEQLRQAAPQIEPLGENVVSLTNAKPAAQAQPATIADSAADPIAISSEAAGFRSASTVADPPESVAVEQPSPDMQALERDPVITSQPLAATFAIAATGHSETAAPVDAALQANTEPEAVILAAVREAPLTENQSLGASLLTRGVVSVAGASKSDPLAPINRMTQAEKIAFFS